MAGMLQEFETFTAECRSYCEKAGIKLATLAAYALDDNTLFDRLEAGGQCHIKTMGKVLTFMAKNPPGCRRGRARKRAA